MDVIELILDDKNQTQGVYAVSVVEYPAIEENWVALNRHFVELKEGDDGYNDNMALLNFRWIPNGTRGKVRVHCITKYIEIYPEHWKGKWEDCPRCRIHFKYGKLMDYEDVTGR